MKDAWGRLFKRGEGGNGNGTRGKDVRNRRHWVRKMDTSRAVLLAPVQNKPGVKSHNSAR